MLDLTGRTWCEAPLRFPRRVSRFHMLKVSHLVNIVFSSRTYFLSNDAGNEFWLVDCGDVASLMEAFSSMSCGSFVMKGVLLTHAHFDHIYGLPRLTELFPEVKVYTNEAGRRTLADSRRNLSRYHGEAIVYESDSVVVCEEGDVVELFDGVSARVYETPGHHPSCLTFEVGEFLFTGDSYIPGVAVVTVLPEAEKSLAAQSQERIKSLAEGKILCPGHEVSGAEF